MSIVIKLILVYGDVQQKYLLQIHGGYSGTESYHNGKYSLDGNIELEVYSQQNNVPEKISIIYDVNGKTVKEQQVEVTEMNNLDVVTNFINIALNEIIDLGANQNLTVYAIIKDNYGLTYKYISKFIEIDSDGNTVHNVPEYTTGTVIEITDKDGKIFYVPKYLQQ